VVLVCDDGEDVDEGGGEGGGALLGGGGLREEGGDGVRVGDVGGVELEAEEGGGGGGCGHFLGGGGGLVGGGWLWMVGLGELRCVVVVVVLEGYRSWWW